MAIRTHWLGANLKEPMAEVAGMMARACERPGRPVLAMTGGLRIGGPHFCAWPVPPAYSKKRSPSLRRIEPVSRGSSSLASSLPTRRSRRRGPTRFAVVSTRSRRARRSSKTGRRFGGSFVNRFADRASFRCAEALARILGRSTRAANAVVSIPLLGRLRRPK